MSALDRFLHRIGLVRDNTSLSFQDWVNYFTFNGTSYLSGLGAQTLGSKQEAPQQNFEGYVQSIYKTNGVVFACQAVRLRLFSEAMFQFRRRVNGRPGELFGTAALRPLERPWNNATTGDLLMRSIQHADLSGNHYSVRRGDKIYPLRPDWTTIVVGSSSEPDDPSLGIDAEVVGYIHQPPGAIGGRRKPDVLLPEEVAHFAPMPDPQFRFRGMSWLTPVIAEIMGDNAATQHKLKFFENGATPNLVVTLDKQTALKKEDFDAFVEKMKTQHEGTLNAYRTLYLANGATAIPVGANMRQIDFKATQGAGETRIAAAAGVPPVIVGLSEGLAAATYSNYGQARRALADATMRPLWRNAAGSFDHLVKTPENAELWYDDRDIKFLQEDQKDAADIFNVKALASEALLRAGFTPDTVIKAVDTFDISQLKHSGLYSIQLQSPGSQKLPETVPGETPTTGAAAPKALPAPAKTTPTPKRDLTDRQADIVEMLGAGAVHKEIAAELGISLRTVAREIVAIRQTAVA